MNRSLEDLRFDEVFGMMRELLKVRMVRFKTNNKHKF